MDKRFSGALSLSQAMQYLGDIGRTKLYEIIKREELEVLYIDTKPVILQDELDRFLAGRRSKADD